MPVDARGTMLCVQAHIVERGAVRGPNRRAGRINNNIGKVRARGDIRRERAACIRDPASSADQASRCDPASDRLPGQRRHAPVRAQPRRPAYLCGTAGTR